MLKLRFDRYITLLVIKMHLLVPRVVNKTLKFRLTFLILLTIKLSSNGHVTVKLKPEIISQEDRVLERLIYDAPDKQTHLITSNVNRL